NVTLDMLVRAQEQLEHDSQGNWQAPVVLMEMTLNNLITEQSIDHQDFLARVDLLGALGKMVMISSYTRFDGVTGYLRKATRNWIAMVIGVPTLREIFEEKYYADLDGGILEGLGRLFQGPVKLLIYPTRESAGGEVATAESLDLQWDQRNLYAHLRQNGRIESIREFDAAQLHITPGEVLGKLRDGDPGWDSRVQQ